MIYLTLGVIVGLIIATFILVVLMYFKTPIERTINRTLSITKKKGEILEPDSEDLKDWVDNLPSAFGDKGGAG